MSRTPSLGGCPSHLALHSRSQRQLGRMSATFSRGHMRQLACSNDVQSRPRQPLVREHRFTRRRHDFLFPPLAKLRTNMRSALVARNYTHLLAYLLEQGKKASQLRSAERRVHNLPLTLMNFAFMGCQGMQTPKQAIRRYLEPMKYRDLQQMSLIT